MLRNILTLAILATAVSAQFGGGFFQGGFPFGGQQRQQQQHHEPGRSHRGWSDMESGEFGRWIQFPASSLSCENDSLDLDGKCASRLTQQCTAVLATSARRH